MRTGETGELERLRTREHELGERIAEATRELCAFEQEIAQHNARLPGLRAHVEEQGKSQQHSSYPTPIKVFLSVLLAPVGALFGLVSGLFAWCTFALPGLIFDIDPNVPITLLPVVMGCFALLGFGYALHELWG